MYLTAVFLLEAGIYHSVAWSSWSRGSRTTVVLTREEPWKEKVK